MLVISLANPYFSSVAALNARPQQREFVDFETRELDEPQLDARDPLFGLIGKAAKKVAGLVLREDENGEQYVAREYDDIEAREPIFGFIKKAAKKVAGLVLREDENGEYYVAREYDDIDLRETPEFDELD